MSGKQAYELPQAVLNIVEARTADAVFVVGPDYNVVYWDERAESLAGFTAGEVVGKRCYEVVLGEREEGQPFCSYGCSVMHQARQGRAVSSYDMRITELSGEKRWVNVSILSVDSEEGPYLVHLMRDSQGVHDTLEMARGLIQLTERSKIKDKKEPFAQTEVPTLTRRQIEVLGLLSKGRSAKEIGRDLYLSEATVRNHIRALLQGLGVHSQLEALARARELGLLPG